MHATSARLKLIFNLPRPTHISSRTDSEISGPGNYLIFAPPPGIRYFLCSPCPVLLRLVEVKNAEREPNMLADPIVATCMVFVGENSLPCRTQADSLHQ